MVKEHTFIKCSEWILFAADPNNLSQSRRRFSLNWGFVLEITCQNVGITNYLDQCFNLHICLSAFLSLRASVRHTSVFYLTLLSSFRLIFSVVLVKGLCALFVFELQLLCGVRIKSALEMGMFICYPRLELVGDMIKRQSQM